VNLVLTLVDNDYYPGLAALINSLIAQGFSGRVVVGATAAFPQWLTASLEPIDQSQDEYRVGGIVLQRVSMETEQHVVHCKPGWIAAMVQRFNDCERIFFIDADITVNTNWTFFEDWADEGVALCSDVNYLMPATDPTRRKWVRALQRAGRPVRSQLDWYVNSGFLGVARKNADFATLWTDIYEENRAYFSDTTKFRTEGREHFFMSANQDTLNLAAMATEHPISIIGPNGMGFMPGFCAMNHPLGPAKPWRRSFIRDALAGNPPRVADKVYWLHADGPVRAFSLRRIKFARLSLHVAAAIGRFIRRT